MPAPNTTARDLEIISIAFQCFKEPHAMKIDFNKFAELGNYKNAASASASWLGVKKRLLGEVGLASKKGTKANDSESPPKQNSSKRKAVEPVDEPVDDSEPDLADSEKTPTAKKERKTIKIEDDADQLDVNEDAGEPPKKKRSYNRKPKDPNAPPKQRKKKPAPIKAEEPESSHFTPINSQFDGVTNDNNDVEPDREFDAEEQAIVAEGVNGILGSPNSAQTAV